MWKPTRHQSHFIPLNPIVDREDPQYNYRTFRMNLADAPLEEQTFLNLYLDFCSRIRKIGKENKLLRGVRNPFYETMLNNYFIEAVLGSPLTLEFNITDAWYDEDSRNCTVEIRYYKDSGMDDWLKLVHESNGQVILVPRIYEDDAHLVIITFDLRTVAADNVENLYGA